MENHIFAVIGLLMVVIILQIISLSHKQNASLQVNLKMVEKGIERLESQFREGIASNRQELNSQLNVIQQSLVSVLNAMAQTQLEQLKAVSDANQQTLSAINKGMGERQTAFGDQFNKNIDALIISLKERFAQLDTRQQELITSNEKKLEQMRETVDEKLQKTLNERLGHSFEMVGKQLENVQKGLGEMQLLAQDVGGLKKVLSNVKMRGGLGEVRLSMLLEQILAPEQYVANVKTKNGSSDMVEFAVKLPGREDDSGPVFLPIDAKFPQEKYTQLVDAYDGGNLQSIETASKDLESTLKKMARDFHVIVTGPSTLAAMLNSLQMGFRTLAIQKRSGEVWKVLGEVKTEFGKFGGLLEKAQKNLHSASSTIDDLVGTRTKAIERRLKDVQALPSGEEGES